MSWRVKWCLGECGVAIAVSVSAILIACSTSARDVASVDATVADAAFDDATLNDASSESSAPLKDAANDQQVCNPSTCNGANTCVGGLCCIAPTPSGAFKLPTHTNYVHWTFGAPLAKLEFAAEFKNDPGSTVGLYFEPIYASIDGTAFYLGFLTDLLNNEAGGKHEGHGVLFSQFGTLDKTKIKLATGGFSEVGTHEGNFIGVRLPYKWTTGSYTLRIERASGGDDTGDWFEIHVVDAAKVDTFAGALKFARKNKGVPATIEPTGTLFTEVYAGATDYAAVPRWQIDTMAYGDNKKAISATSEYPNYPVYPGLQSFPNTNVAYNKGSDRVELSFGGDTAKCHSAGKLF